MARLKRHLDNCSPHQTKKNVVKVGPPLTKLSGSAHVMSIKAVAASQDHLQCSLSHHSSYCPLSVRSVGGGGDLPGTKTCHA